MHLLAFLFLQWRFKRGHHILSPLTLHFGNLFPFTTASLFKHSFGQVKNLLQLHLPSQSNNF